MHKTHWDIATFWSQGQNKNKFPPFWIQWYWEFHGLLFFNSFYLRTEFFMSFNEWGRMPYLIKSTDSKLLKLLYFFECHLPLEHKHLGWDFLLPLLSSCVNPPCDTEHSTGFFHEQGGKKAKMSAANHFKYPSSFYLHYFVSHKECFIPYHIRNWTGQCPLWTWLNPLVLMHHFFPFKLSFKFYFFYEVFYDYSRWKGPPFSGFL